MAFRKTSVLFLLFVASIVIARGSELPRVLEGSVGEPDYVTNLKKYFNDGDYTGTYYRKITSKEELESKAKEVFREWLKLQYSDIERFFNEWKMTFISDGPFNSEKELSDIKEKITKPDDFMTELYIENMLTNRDDAEGATKAFFDALLSKDDERVALFYMGDDDIMHGVMAAGVRKNMDAVFVIFLID